MKKLLVVVDMQNDFITGSLGTREAQKLVHKLSDFVLGFDGNVVYTQDTHQENYLFTQEGRNLPVVHCIEGSEGHKIVDNLNMRRPGKSFFKLTFGSWDLGEYLKSSDYNEVHFVGVCTGICVISNAVIAKAVLPEAGIFIHKDLCACVTPESHERALESMSLLQMNIV